MAGDMKGALGLLSGYGSSDNSDEESVPGVRVSVKRAVPADWNTTEEKKRSADIVKLPLPPALRSLYNKDEQERTDDDPLLHEGRVRSFPHERGNWVTFVYIPCDPSPSLHTLLEVFCNLLESIAVLKPVSDLHISLTQTVVLRHHWIDPFVDSVSEKVKELPRFRITFDSVNVYCNEAKTRTFIGLTVSSGADALMSAIRVLDECLSEFKLPAFYEDPSFHLSIGWCLGDLKEPISTLVPQLDVVFQQFRQAQPDKWHIDVEKLMCRTGNKYFTFQLQS
ncbi:U6 snRNA phosphodiesterase isoform X1 [Schistocerca americana]|uniref:U6 snRNA phosphodiesterase isoform X1 n=1 Tax=Schistocerca americana TaxID=7009 RepID=UPI001F4F730A|nr:U6 snRNA phosphodiesterase isoform X1 [Schistocerca americana]